MIRLIIAAINLYPENLAHKREMNTLIDLHCEDRTYINNKDHKNNIHQLTVSLNFTAKKIASASSSHQLLLGQLLFASLQEPRAKKYIPYCHQS